MGAGCGGRRSASQAERRRPGHPPAEGQLSAALGPRRAVLKAGEGQPRSDRSWKRVTGTVVV